MRRQNELFQSRLQKFKAFNLSPNTFLHFANDWQFETGDTAREFVLEKKWTLSRLVSGKASELFMAGHRPQRSACKHLMQLSIKASDGLTPYERGSFS